jgi:Cdc6-like AAA superfamily ATPase
MKILVVGGTSGIGKDIADWFYADAIGRSSGHTLPEQSDAVVEKSLNYNCVINCISDSTQLAIASDMYEAHDRLGLNTYFITIGSMTWRIEQPHEGKRKLFDWAESLITRKTKLKHTLLNPAWMYNTREQGLFENISKEEMLSTLEYLLKASKNNSKIHILEIQGTPK